MIIKKRSLVWTEWRADKQSVSRFVTKFTCNLSASEAVVIVSESKMPKKE